MALRKTIDLLPEIFRTQKNEKFLNATLDQLITPVEQKKLNGYIGRKFAPSYKKNDAYITEPTNTRQNYQLEPGVVYKSKDDIGNSHRQRIEFLTNYTDIVNKIQFYGGNVDNHSRLFKNEYYNWSSFFDFDKFVNFSQYYWLANGPDSVQVFTSFIDTEIDFTVTRVSDEVAYNITNYNTVNNPTITLARGGTYTFNVNQLGNSFWIQTEPGTDGNKDVQQNISTREIYGVQNNGDDVGVITFNVPAADAQNLWITMPKTGNVDFLNTLTYKQTQSRVFSQFIVEHPEGFDGITELSIIDGSTLAFYSNSNDSEENWESGGLFDDNGFDSDSSTFDPTTYVDEEERYDVYLVNVDDDGIIRLNRILDIPQNEKILITKGETYGNRELWKNAIQKLELVPLITAPLTRLYYQDGSDETRYGIINLVEPGIIPIIDITNDIIGKQEYISPNLVEFTNGMKIEFNSDVSPSTYAGKEYYIEGVGNSITLVPVEELIVPETFTISEEEGFSVSPYDTTGYAGSSNAPVNPDYITINKSSIDRNAWSRSNRWTHIDVIKKTAEYNNFNLIIDQDKRANRPIIEFEPNIQLYNYGSVFNRSITVLDNTQVDALSNVEGAAGYFADGIQLLNGMTIIWNADLDENVRSKIYQVSMEDPQNDGNEQIHLTEIGNVTINDVILITNGATNQGLVYHYNGSDWILSQQKTTLNQSPWFDIFDVNGNSYSDESIYIGTGFSGCKLFSYQQQSTGNEDTVLGFPLSYKNFENVGDIIFENNYSRDKFTYTTENIIKTVNINSGFVHKIIDRDTSSIHNDWMKINHESKQYQLIEYIVTPTMNQTFDVTVTPEDDNELVNLFVYKNNKLLLRNTPSNISNNISTDYTVLQQDSNYLIILDQPAEEGDLIAIRVYSKDKGNGYYEIPKNLENNALNSDFTTLTLGQIRNHITEISTNISTFVGTSPGSNNLRDISNLKTYPGKILQHSAGMHLSAFLLSDENVNFKLNQKHVHNSNFIDSIEFARTSYSKFKNKFLDAISTLDLDFSDIPSALNIVINELKIGKTETFPFFYSDMIGCGDDNVTVTYTVDNTDLKTYDYGIMFDNTVSSNRSVIVYLNDVQMYLDYDYTFDTDGANIIFTDLITLEIGDVIKIVDYTNTDGTFIPPTPTKMGMYPKFKPEKYTDNTFLVPTNVIQGHDGSITIAFNDSRDDLILELEKRIYNNIKIEYKTDVFDLNDIIPGKFRETDYSRDEINFILSTDFLSWSLVNKISYKDQLNYDVQNKFTWNWSNFTDKITNELLPGHWRGVYRYFYDTDRPHTHPWEMLGLSEKPKWWDERYGLLPYTKGNEVLWEDLRDGKLYSNGVGDNYTILNKYTRPNLKNVIPVDESGNLVDPLVSVVAAYNSVYSNEPYVFGDVGPAESAWRRSSDYPFSIQKLAALTQPAKFFSVQFDTENILRSEALDQIIDSHTLRRVSLDELRLHGTTTGGVLNRINGVSQIISDYAVHKNIHLDNIIETLQNLQLQLIYRVGGYTDKKFIKVIAEQVSPTSTNKGIFIPDDDYDIELTKSTPIDGLSLSGVVITKNTNGWSVSGYDIERPYFNVIPSIINDNNYSIRAGEGRNSPSGIVYRDYKNTIQRVNYNTEFTNKQQVVDFFVSYQRYLQLKGFVFDETLPEETGSLVKDWILSAKEFLFWQSQGWKIGSTIALNPVSDKIKFERFGTIPDTLSANNVRYKILNQNFKPIRFGDLEVSRIDNLFTVQAKPSSGPIYLIEISPVQYEHTIVFKNSTVFNDILYQPELGSRQYRLKIVGLKTSSWDGTFQSPGYIYNTDITETWQPGKDYKKGDFIIFRKKTYVAIKDQDALQVFDHAYWKIADNIKVGLLPNLTNKSDSFSNFYDINSVNLESETDKFGKGIIGYQKRDYLENLELDDVSQVKFYQGMIRQKGSGNSINKLIRAQLDNMDSDINYFEEWAFRVGEYGAIDANQVIEITLNESEFTSNPELVEFINTGDTRPLYISYDEQDLYKKPNNYNKNIFSNRSLSNTKTDITSAGFPRLDDVNTTIFDINNISSLNNQLQEVGSGYIIWTAKNLSNVWDVYRVSETGIQITSVQDKLDNQLVITTDKNHNLTKNTFICIKNIEGVSGFYKIVSVLSNIEFIVNLEQQGISLDQQTGILFKLDSVKFSQPSSIATYSPLFGWQDNELIWIENSSNNWKVLKKTSPWNYSNLISSDSITTSNNLGTNFSSSLNNLWAVSGIPSSGTGKVITYVKTISNNYSENSVLNPSTVTGINGFGTSVSAGNETFFAVGAPSSNSGSGYVLIYKKDSGNTFNLLQVISPSSISANALFGSSVVLSDDEKWLYIGATGENSVYVYAKKTVSSLNESVVTEVGDDIKTSSTLYWFPESIDEIIITDSTGKSFVPNIDYTISGNVVNFTFTLVGGVSYVIRRVTTYKYITKITPGDIVSGDNFGTCMDTTENGRILVVGAPQHDVDGVVDAGAVWVYERVQETFYGDGATQSFTTTNTIADIYEVYVNGELQTYTPNPDTGIGDSTIGFYTITGNTVTFKYLPENNSKIDVEVNEFLLVQKLTNTTPEDTDNYGTTVSVDLNASWIAVGSPGEDELNPNTGSVFVYVDQAKKYGTILGSEVSPTISLNDSIRINDVVVQMSSGSTLSSIIEDINDKNIPGITASNSNNQLKISSTSEVTNNKLRVMPCIGQSYTYHGLGINSFVLTQKINHPSSFENENFGKAVDIDRTSEFLVIGSDRASTIKTVKFDVINEVSTTTFDKNSTKFFDREIQSGAVYVYELMSNDDESISNPSLYAYVQQLQSNTIESFDQFGSSVYIRSNKIIVGSPGYDKTTAITNSGILYDFTNDNTRSWITFREEDSKVDTELLNKSFIYNKRTNEIIEYLDWIDPIKGKISGLAKQELTHISDRDPAIYNINTNQNNTTRATLSWTSDKIGSLWWDTSTVKYIEYEQGDLLYRSEQWGSKFPGSSIDVYEWVESLVPPNQYAGTGSPKYNDNSSYVSKNDFNVITDKSSIKYYFWVKNKTTVPNVPFRKLDSFSVARIIDDPRAYGLFYISIIKSNALLTNNITSLLSDSDIVLHINYDVIKNNNILHSEYQLLAENDEQNVINNKLYNKFLDSLSGTTETGRVVPQRNINPSQKYGILFRPRQTMFINKDIAVKLFVDFCNSVFKKYQIANQFDLSLMNSEEQIPGEQTSAWDEKVLTYVELTYLIPAIYPVGYKVLVQNDETNDNLWAIYEKQSNNTWTLNRIQAYNTSKYWNRTTWYADGYNENTVINYTVQTKNDLEILKPKLNNGDIVKIKNNDQGLVSVVVLNNESFDEVIVENATIELKSSLYDYTIESTGFDTGSFDNIRYDQRPVTEIRKIIQSIKNDIFIKELKIQWNKLWFTMIEYILTEQPYADWLFKSSFIKVIHKLRGLDQYPNFQRDNQDYIKDYINEVKPYRTNIREYILKYTKDDPFGGDVYDFDLHSYYDLNLSRYRQPNGERSSDQALQSQGLNLPWYNNYKYEVGSVIIEDGGTGYTEPPKLTTVGGGGTGVILEAVTNGNQIIDVIVVDGGIDFITTPTISVVGTGTGLKLSVRLTNSKIRKISQTIKFDRYTYSSNVREWTKNTVYLLNDIISYNGEAYQVTTGFTSGTTFDSSNLIIYDDINFTNAADRIMAYYLPSSGMIGKDISQLQLGTDYPGVKIYGPDFSANPGYDVGAFDIEPLDSFEIDENGITVISGASSIDTIIQSNYTDTNLGLAPEDINIDGGEYYDTYNSHAPEELVPGIVFDTLDMKVYTTPSQDNQYDGNGFRIYTYFHIGDGSTSTFSYTNGSSLQDVDNLFVWLKTGGVQYKDTHYTVDYNNKTITFSTAPSDDNIIYVYAFGNAGEKPVYEGTVLGDGASDTFTIEINPDIVTQAYVLVDGEISSNPSISENGNKTDITLSTVPSNGSHVHLMLFNLDTSRTAYTSIEEQVFVYDGSTRSFILNNPIKYAEPFAANVIVEVNGSRLRPDNVVYYSGDNSTVTFNVPTSGGETQSLINNTDIKVGVINIEDATEISPVTNKVAGVDYTINPYDGSSIRSITFVGDDSSEFVPGVNDIVIVGITTDSEYEISSDGNTLTIDNSVTLNSNDKIRVITFSNHDPVRIQTKVFKGKGTTNPGQRFEMDRNMSNTDYLWVTVDGQKLQSAEGFEVQGNEIIINNNVVLTNTSIVVVTSFTENIMQPAIGFRIFKDMLNNFNYYRISDDNTTTLSSELLITDAIIYVEDSSVLSTPDKTSGNPGVIMVSGERITYWEKDDTTNTLTKIRRATGGTGAKTSYPAGTYVYDMGNQKIPGNTHTKTWYDLGSSSASSQSGLQHSSTVQAMFLKEKRTTV